MAERIVGWPIFVGVVVDDMEAERRFYRDVLGIRELGAGEGWAWFDMGWPNLFELLQRSDDPASTERRYQVGFAVQDIRSARDELVARGAEPIGEIEGGPKARGYWAYFRDPEGNVFEITQRLGEPWPSA